jgi:hypothetical protein
MFLFISPCKDHHHWKLCLFGLHLEFEMHPFRSQYQVPNVIFFISGLTILAINVTVFHQEWVI